MELEIIMRIFKGFLFAAIFLVAINCEALTIQMRLVAADGKGKVIGNIKANDTIYGLLLTPKLHGLTPGIHGFHLHVMPSCSDNGNAAGGHFDPVQTGLHRGPYRGGGHLGDLPVLIVDQAGLASLPILAPRLKLALIEGHSLIIHDGGDDYSENALKQPGSQTRIACGLVPWF